MKAILCFIHLAQRSLLPFISEPIRLKLLQINVKHPRIDPKIRNSFREEGPA
jgi:hypothetical protein